MLKHMELPELYNLKKQWTNTLTTLEIYRLRADCPDTKEKLDAFVYAARNKITHINILIGTREKFHVQPEARKSA